ncbi:hypothetical protein [Halobacteriovorax sp. DA5]|uniref:hypothetical protein n=1 Tax=Halobacteriovorax sp. DA5 TaxID=2067553 RepID=UPI000CD0FCA4|nr:hypothetical protein [Halobacteriovorax sp. DA5]POB14526.1 hypothetical protein C0Z22_05385 [Halobacteriovorax sp. DA5]
MSDGDNKNDLTRIEDLSEFLHQGDDELDKLLADLDESDDGQSNEQEDEQEDEAEIELAPFEYSNNSNDSENEFEDEAENYENFSEEESYDEADYAFDGPELEDEESGQESDEEQSFDNFDNFDNFEESDNFDEVDDFEESADLDSVEEEQSDDEDSSFENFPTFQEDQEADQEEDQEAEIELSPLEEDQPEYEAESEVEQEDFVAPQIESYEQVETPLTATPETVAPEIRPAQDFREVRDFAANSTYGKVAIGGNPPFSILMQGIVPGEYDESILAILNEHGLLGDNEELYRRSLESGQLLIAQIGEFSAIYLAGKLRRFCRVIKLGLAHEIHASPNYDNSDQRGLTGPRSINQNQTKHFIRNDRDFTQEDVLLSSSHFVPGYLITHSLGPMQINEVIDGNEFNDIKSINLIEYFSELFRESAFKKGANAIISIHFTVNQQRSDSTSNNIIIMAHGDYVVLEENKA